MPNSIYSKFDSRLNNPMFNQQTGAYGFQPNTAASPTGSPTAGSATGQGGYSPGAAPNLESLTSMINNLNLQGQQAANQGRIPNDPALEAKSSQNIGQELGGQLPGDVITQLQQQAAERGIATGSPGSDNSNAAYLRALGLNSLSMQQQGQTDLSHALARNPGAPIFDPTTQLLTPAQAGALNTRNAELSLDWWKALQNPTGYGGGRGGGGAAPTTQDISQGHNWFTNLMGGTPGPVAPPPSSSGLGFSSDTLYPGTEVPGLGNLGGILGAPDPGYGLSPDPFGQGSFGGDASSPDFWDFNNADAFGGYDPFSQL